MLLEIKKIDENKFIAKFANEEIEISEQLQDWNIEWINKFLIKLASKTPTNEKIELKFNDQEKNKVYLHLIDLFQEFINEYNGSNVGKGE